MEEENNDDEDLDRHLNPPSFPSLDELFNPLNMDTPQLQPQEFEEFLGNYLRATDIKPPNCQQMVLDAIRELLCCTLDALMKYIESQYGRFYLSRDDIKASLAILMEVGVVERETDDTYIPSNVLVRPSYTRSRIHYSQMVLEAIRELDEKDGSREETIMDYIKFTYNKSPTMFKEILKFTFKILVEQGEIEVTSNSKYILPGHYQHLSARNFEGDMEVGPIYVIFSPDWDF